MYAHKNCQILDNQPGRKVGKFLSANIVADANLRVATAYFTLPAYVHLREELEKIGQMWLLFGDPLSTSKLDPQEEPIKSFVLGPEGQLQLKDALRQKWQAKACADWIKRKVDIRSAKKTGLMHAKMYHIANGDGKKEVAISGSSNFTSRGLGLGSGQTDNIELNLTADEHQTGALKAWFDDIWQNDQLTKDAKETVVDELARLGKNYSPKFIYYKTLYEIFKKRYEQQESLDSEIKKHSKQFTDSGIWGALYEFQKHGAKSVINRLKEYGGCIIADSVGLGKTYEALAVIKYFELKNERVLVLSPTRLRENWNRFRVSVASKYNPFLADKFNYALLAHTDLTRTKGYTGDVRLEEFNWGNFDLVVIDESHNFRNQPYEHLDRQTGVKIRSRYGTLMSKVIQEGCRTKVLMLSATPVNTSLIDLRNQIYLITRKTDTAFQEKLGIKNLKTLFSRSQKVYTAWEKQLGKNTAISATDKDALFESLDGDLIRLLDAVSIARSRKHIEKFYPKFFEETHNRFPSHNKPVNIHAATDSKQEIEYSLLNASLEKLSLGYYKPSEFLIDGQQTHQKILPDKTPSALDQTYREKYLVAMMRTNFLKRLESSVYAFNLTIKRTIEKMNAQIKKIDAFKKSKVDTYFNLEYHVDDNQLEEDPDFVVGRGSGEYKLRELDVSKWRKAIKEDMNALEDIYEQTKMIGPERDEKLSKLKGRIIKHFSSKKKAKLLIFTSFSDTAQYLYKELGVEITDLDLKAGLITGGDGVKSTVVDGPKDFQSVLSSFAPAANHRTDKRLDDTELNILIATDCISEGQNLQDCDTVVNYDIHWNPVRIIQRFGRIDRIGSKHKHLNMINFWPTEDLDEYLDLHKRVRARMVIANLAATQHDNLLEDEEVRNNHGHQLNFLRENQLRKMYSEVLTFDDLQETGISLADFSFGYFIRDLRDYLEKQKAVQRAPWGIFALTEASGERLDGLSPGVIFCLKHKSASERPPNNSNPIAPFYLVYVSDDGQIIGHTTPLLLLKHFSRFARNQDSPVKNLCNLFDNQTVNGTEMGDYDRLIDRAVESCVSGFMRASMKELQKTRQAVLPKTADAPKSAGDYELVTWLIIKNPSHT